MEPAERQRIIARQALREQSRKVGDALGNKATPDAQLYGLFNDLRDKVTAEKARTETARKNLDAQVGYSKNPRLGIALTLALVAGPTHTLIKFRPMKSMPVMTYHITVGVIGTGAMGRGIAQVAAAGGMQVLMSDSRPGAATEARDFIEKMLARAAEKDAMTKDEAADYYWRMFIKRLE